jgi:hypothetical protein
MSSIGFPCNSSSSGPSSDPYGSGPYGSGPYGGLAGPSSSPSNPLQYYLSLLTSEYANSPNLQAFTALCAQPFMDVMLCLCSMPGKFNLNPALGPLASGSQLDMIGTRIGASRTLPFQPVGVNALTTEAISSTGVHTVTTNNTTYMQIGVAQTITGSDGHTESPAPTAIVQGVSFTANFTQTHVTASTITTPAPSPILSDANYIVLLQAKILQNQWNGQGQGVNNQLWAAWQVMFPGGRLIITDNQNMTCNVLLLGAFNPIMQQMITAGMIVPRPEAVAYVYIFPTLPAFGFGSLNPTLIQGFGTGYWNG